MPQCFHALGLWQNCRSLKPTISLHVLPCSCHCEIHDISATLTLYYSTWCRCWHQIIMSFYVYLCGWFPEHQFHSSYSKVFPAHSLQLSRCPFSTWETSQTDPMELSQLSRTDPTAGLLRHTDWCFQPSTVGICWYKPWLNHDWLVVYLPSWKIWVRQWEGWQPIYEMDNNPNVWNHQPEYIIQNSWLSNERDQAIQHVLFRHQQWGYIYIYMIYLITDGWLTVNGWVTWDV